MPEQPTADLRTLARRAFWPIVEAAFPDASLRQVLDAGQLAAINRALYAGIVAVLPAHRAMVLAEAAEAIEAKAADLGRTRNVAEEEAVLRVAHTVRRLAATGPTGGLSATESAERGEAVPEEADATSRAPTVRTRSRGPSLRPSSWGRAVADEELVAELANVIHAHHCGCELEAEPGGDYRNAARAVLAWLAERGRLVPDGVGKTVEGCGCPIRYAVAKIEEHTRECGTRRAAERLARHLDEEYGWVAVSAERVNG